MIIYISDKVLVLVFLLVVTSCDNFLDVDLPKSQIDRDAVFKNEITATSAINGVYHDMMNDLQGFASGSDKGVWALSGLSSDELVSYSTDLGVVSFNSNTLTPENANVLTLWSSIYNIVYQSNSIIEGLDEAKTIPENTRMQLKGEALFIRAFCNFYLVNLFGEVPLVLGTDYQLNMSIKKSSIDVIYSSIKSDLVNAQTLLLDNYITNERVRPNKAVATALLSRVYLYTRDWINAEEQSSRVIADSRYGLVALDDVFKANSAEAIWQLAQVDPTFNTMEGYFSILQSSPVNNYLTSNVLSEELVQVFQEDDLRKNAWLASYSEGSDTWYYPYKYKISVGGPGSNPPVNLTEYSMVFRLAEQYLIRAEARLMQGDMQNAVNDLDSIRNRAGLKMLGGDMTGFGVNDLLDFIEQERRVELFVEWGHRWFDLKRTGRSDEVLSSIKPSWNSTDVLYPIPQQERRKNPNLGEQNSGY